MAIISIIRKFINSSRQLSMETTLSIITSMLGIFIASFFTPIILRWILLPKVVTYSQNLDFTFNTCVDQLHGACSFPEAIIDLEQTQTPLSAGYYYTFALDLQLFDTEQNRQLGVFLAQITPKDASGNPISNYKKSVLFRPSLVSSIYIMTRNIIFFPLYLIGYFPSFDTRKAILFTDQLYESYDKPTKLFIIQLQNRYIQVSSAEFTMRAQIGFSGRLLHDYPMITYIFTFSISFMIYCGIFALYWANHGVKVIAEVDANDNPIVQRHQVAQEVEMIPYFKILIQSLLPTFIQPTTKKNPKSKIDTLKRKTEPEPSPNVWNRNETPVTSVLENIPGWNVHENDLYQENSQERIISPPPIDPHDAFTAENFLKRKNSYSNIVQKNDRKRVSSRF